MCEEKEGVMRNAMTTRAPGGANKVSPPRMFFILLFPSISGAQYDMNPGNFGVIEFLIFVSKLGGDKFLNQNPEGHDQLPRGVQSPIKTAK